MYYRIAANLFLIISALFFAQCSSTKRATSSRSAAVASISKEGFIDCFEKGLSNNGLPVWCEASAILYDGNKLLLANDKDMPGTRSAIFSVLYQNNAIDTTQQPVYYNHPLLKKVSKYEDFAQTPDGRFTLLSTGFDRVKPGSADWDNYNTILYWQQGNEDHPKVLTAAGKESDSTSVSLRPMITAALASSAFPQGPPYYKIEGLGTTDKNLYLGVREEGKRYDSFQYQIKILAIPYTVTNNTIQLSGACKVFANMDISLLKPGTENIALSSIEYDPYNKRFYILTSYENGNNLGGYLWTATEAQLQHNQMILVKDAAGQPLRFTHKSEDLAIISKSRIIVIHDDDRATLLVNGVVRQPYQAAYSVVDFK
jgi:hypothetical protein